MPAQRPARLPRRGAHALDAFLTSHQPCTFLDELRLRLLGADGKCRVPLVNALVLHVGTHAIAALQSQPASQAAAGLAHSAPMDVEPEPEPEPEP